MLRLKKNIEKQKKSIESTDKKIKELNQNINKIKSKIKDKKQGKFPGSLLYKIGLTKAHRDLRKLIKRQKEHQEILDVKNEALSNMKGRLKVTHADTSKITPYSKETGELGETSEVTVKEAPETPSPKQIDQAIKIKGDLNENIEKLKLGTAKLGRSQNSSNEPLVQELKELIKDLEGISNELRKPGVNTEQITKEFGPKLQRGFNILIEKEIQPHKLGINFPTIFEQDSISRDEILTALKPLEGRPFRPKGLDDNLSNYGVFDQFLTGVEADFKEALQEQGEENLESIIHETISGLQKRFIKLVEAKNRLIDELIHDDLQRIVKKLDKDGFKVDPEFRKLLKQAEEDGLEGHDSIFWEHDILPTDRLDDLKRDAQVMFTDGNFTETKPFQDSFTTFLRGIVK